MRSRHEACRVVSIKNREQKHGSTGGAIRYEAIAWASIKKRDVDAQEAAGREKKPKKKKKNRRKKKEGEEQTTRNRTLAARANYSVMSVARRNWSRKWPIHVGQSGTKWSGLADISFTRE